MVKMNRLEYPSDAQRRKLAKQNKEELKKNPKIDAVFKQTENQDELGNASLCVMMVGAVLLSYGKKHYSPHSENFSELHVLQYQALQY